VIIINFGLFILFSVCVSTSTESESPIFRPVHNVHINSATALATKNHFITIKIVFILVFDCVPLARIGDLPKYVYNSFVHIATPYVYWQYYTTSSALC
jgi:hypothetical protein